MSLQNIFQFKKKNYSLLAIVGVFVIILAAVGFQFLTSGAHASLSGRPSAITLGTSNITSETAKVHGHVDANGSHRSVFWFEWGRSAGDLDNQTPREALGESRDVSFILSTLRPDTTYFYRIVAGNGEGHVSGSVHRFTTNREGSGVAPTVITRSAVFSSYTFATLHGTVASGGTPRTGVSFEWGKTLALVNRTQTQSVLNGSSDHFLATLKNLNPGTTYYYRAMAVNKHGVSSGSIFSFRTPTLPGSGVSHKAQTTPSEKSYQASIEKRISSVCASSCSLDMTTGTVLAGTQATFTITVQNTGSGVLTGGIITNTLSPFLSFVSASDGGEYDPKTHEISWAIDSLKPGEQESVKFTVKAESAKGNVTASGYATYSWNGATGESSVRSGETKLQINTSAVAIGGSINVDNKTVKAGGKVAFTIVYKNKTQVPVHNVAFRIILPDEMQYLRGEGGTPLGQAGQSLIYTSKDIEPGATQTITFNAKVAENAEDGATLTTTMLIGYVNPLTGERRKDTASVDVTVSGGVGGAGFFGVIGSSPLLPNSFIGWFILLLVLVVLILIIRQLFLHYDERHKKELAKEEAERQVQLLRERMTGNYSYGNAPPQPPFSDFSGPSPSSDQNEGSYSDRSQDGPYVEYQVENPHETENTNEAYEAYARAAQNNVLKDEPLVVPDAPEESTRGQERKNENNGENGNNYTPRNQGFQGNNLPQ